jgi:hypothetical protein
MKPLFCLILTLSLTVLSTTAAWGTSATGFGARAIGMGGAYTAVADDESAAYWNPAGVTQTDYFRFACGAGYHGSFVKLQNALEKLSDDQMPDREDLNGSYSLTALVGFTSRYLGLNVYSDNHLTTAQDAQNNISATMESYNYGLLTVAGSFGADQQWSVGVNFKKVYAGYSEVNLPALPAYNDPNLATYTASTSYNTATGTACDLGFLYRLDPDLTFGFTVRNLYSQLDSDTGTTTNYGFQVVNGTEVVLAENSTSTYNHPIELPKSYVLGVALRPFEHTLLAVDFESITNSSNDQTRLHVGMEQTALWNLLAFRAGYYSDKDENGYTAGLGFNLWIFKCNVAYVQVADPVYVATANISF